MFERFTDPAKRAIALAQEEARILNHNYIGTEHILLGLVHEGDGAAAKVLKSLKISLEAVRRQVEEIIGRGQAAPTGALPFTPRAKKVLELSFREALQLGHNYIGTEHILLGLIREGEGVAAQVLQKLGADLDRLHDRVVRIIVQRALEPEEEIPTEARVPTERRMPPSGPSCPSCSLPLENALAYRTLLAAPAEEEGDPISLFVLFCKSCGGIVRTSLD